MKMKDKLALRDLLESSDRGTVRSVIDRYTELDVDGAIAFLSAFLDSQTDDRRLLLLETVVPILPRGLMPCEVSEWIERASSEAEKLAKLTEKYL